MTRRMLAVALVLAGCGGTARRQAATPATPPPVRAPSVYALLGERERLELTSGQVEALDSIGQWLASETQQLRRDLGQGPQAGSARPDTATIATTSDAITAAHVRAIQGVEALLNERQRELVCTIQRGDDRPRGAQARPQRPMARGGGAMMGPGTVRWTWCAEEAPTE